MMINIARFIIAQQIIDINHPPTTPAGALHSFVVRRDPAFLQTIKLNILAETLHIVYILKNL
jgi:hypothetical protein